VRHRAEPTTALPREVLTRERSEPPGSALEGESISFLLLVVLAAALPFESTHPGLVFPLFVVTPLEALLYSFVLVWVLLRLAGRRLALPGTFRTAALAGFCAIQFVSAALAPIERLNAVKGAARLLSGGLLFVAAFDVLSSQARLRAVLWAFVAGGSLAALLGTLEAWQVRDVADWLYRTFGFKPSDLMGIPRASGPLQDPNTLAMFLETVLATLLGLIASRVWLAGTALVLTFTGLALTYSRAGLATAGLVVVLFCAGARALAWTRGRRAMMAGGAILAAVLSLMAVSSTFFALRWSRQLPRRYVMDDVERRELWAIAMRLVAENPLLGVGPDNFRLRYAAYVVRPDLGDTRKTAHSLYLETAAGSGLVGLGLLLAFLGSWLRELRKRVPKLTSADERLLALGLALAPGAVLLHGLVDNFLGRTGIFGAFWILLAASLRSAGVASGTETPRGDPGSRPLESHVIC
jgi:O-antigen ligase